MNHRTSHLYTAYFMLIIGTMNILIWPILILTAGVEDFADNHVFYIFHWTSELAMALLLIAASVKVLKEHSNARNYMLLALGFLSISIGGAFAYYMQNFNLAMFSFSAIVTGLTIISIIIIYKSLKDFIFLTFGVGIYSLLNILGEVIQNSNFSMIVMAVPALLFLTILSISLLKKDIALKYFTKQAVKNQKI